MTQSIDIDILANQLLGKWGDLRREIRYEIGTSRYGSDPSKHYTKQRKRTLKNIKNLSNCIFTKVGFPENIVGGTSDAGGGLAVFEELIFLDGSTQIKYGVQFGLFASAILHLGTEYHHSSILPNVVNFTVPGCFAMTETGHGSDVAHIDTTATYQHDTKELVINSPSTKSWKDYIGNAAKDGKAAVVFAQLIVGEENHGVHAIYVPLRNYFGFPLRGVEIEDDGYKGGLNGIDNGRLAFHNVRVPKKNLLNRYGDINENGEYESPIESKGRRFFTMLGTLVQGRVSLVGAVTNAEKLALLIAVRYAHERKQFPNGTSDEFNIIDYPSHQKRLYTRLASLYGQIGMHQKLVDSFHEIFSSTEPDEEKVSQLETDAAAIKAISTWNALETIQISREACGGQGFLSENRLVELRKDLDVYATFEGDNHVLLQLVAKRLLQNYAEKMRDPELIELVKYVSHKIIKEAHSGNVVGLFREIILPIKQAFNKNGDSEYQYRDIIQKNLEISIEELASSLMKAKKQTSDSDQVFLQFQNAIVELGKKYAMHLHHQGIVKLIEEADSRAHKLVLKLLEELFVISVINKEPLEYINKGLTSIGRINNLKIRESELLKEIRKYDLDLVEAFDIDDALVRAPIGLGAELRRNLK